MKARQSARRRGQPLLALILLMVSWVGARAAMWEAPTPVAAQSAVRQRAVDAAKPKPKSIQPKGPAAPRIVPVERVLEPPVQSVPLPGDVVEAVPMVDPSAPAIEPAQSDLPVASPAHDQAAMPSPRKGLSPSVAAGHQELYAAGMNMQLADESEGMDAPRAQRFPVISALPQSLPRQSRWSADAWMLLRQGGNGFNAPGAGLPGVVVPVGFYGGSQAGAVLRYRLSLTSPLRPMLYLRGSSGLQYPRGEEVAAGFSIRPLPKVPLAVMAEGRATRTISGTRVRPAIAVVTELPPARLPLGARGEVYVQAGYVGGPDSSAFVDGQARIERPLVRSGKLELRAGAGVWGGAQKGAQRLDVGPTATLAVPIGPAGARVSADYRIRVGGRAAPGSGAVLTLSAGF